ncbi:MAG: thioredoxin family protein [Anaerolineae bacterium]|nr:thioredoxin family protein [Anaerolineae bacterium]
MIERAVLTLVLLTVGVLVYRWCTRCQMRQAGAAIEIDPLLADCRPGIPIIVYFTTPTCAPCRFQQTPVLEQLQRELDADHLRLIRVDATEDPDAATRWGVFSVPTLFVLDPEGQPRKVFNGVVGLDRLKQELQAS